jgi:N-terminal domain of unknown function (DUF4140)
MLGETGTRVCLDEPTTMHFRFWVCLGLSAQICISGFAELTPASKITEVVVYGDRARVSRELTISVPAGDYRFDLAGLPADLDENSVGIGIRSGAAVTIRGLDLQREFLSENADARSADLLKQLEQLQDQKRDLQSEKSVLEDRREFFRKLNTGGDRIEKPVFSSDELTKLYDLYSGELKTIANAFLEIEAADRKLNPEIERIQKELSQLNQKKEQRRLLLGQWLSIKPYRVLRRRAKGLVEKIPHSRRYRLLPQGYSICLVFLKLFERIYAPLTAGLLSPFNADSKLHDARRSQLDRLYARVLSSLDELLFAVGLKAA